MRSLLLGLAAVGLTAIAGCKSPSARADDHPVDAASSSTPGPRGAPQNPAAMPGATVAAVAGEPFPERFVGEASGRPAGTHPTVEAVYAALEAAGLTITGKRQHLASPLGARYCVGAQAVSASKETLLQMSVCECASREVAQAARDFTTTTNIPLRTAYANGPTLLILREEKSAPEVDRLVTTASTVFGAL
jgi:hypothetical protein